ncbi:hypothetical protein EVAR_418_1 [Eumeta japonica]|uniref:Uncharacterized protein n=1 Tax=Eumeta variegata TaxID=151549 RepID=A0A4C1SAE5_EUMVA|nr:hypothetical protein EVAR_418_1 [Eumeta japonica]
MRLLLMCFHVGSELVLVAVLLCFNALTFRLTRNKSIACNTLAVLRSNRVQLENRLTFGTTCESSLLTSVNVVHDLSSPSVVRFQQFPAAIRLRFAQEIGSVEPSVRFIKVGRRVSCRVISDVQFRRHPPPTFHRRVFLQFGQTMSDNGLNDRGSERIQDRTVRESVQNILRVTFNSISVSIDEANRAPNSAACNSSRGIDITFKGATRAFAISETALSCSLNFIRQYTAAAYDFSLASTNTCSSPRCGGDMHRGILIDASFYVVHPF